MPELNILKLNFRIIKMGFVEMGSVAEWGKLFLCVGFILSLSGGVTQTDTQTHGYCGLKTQRPGE